MRSALLGLAVLLSCSDRSPAPTRPVGPDVREIAVTAKGFEPARVEVPPGKPVILRFTRKVQDTCADAVDLQGDPVRHMLPLDMPVEVKLTAPASGQVAFACPMQGMIHGAVVVVPN